MEYDVNYFIAKFEAIPEKDWNDFVQQTDNGTRCAFGHCLPLQAKIFGSDYFKHGFNGANTQEGIWLQDIFIAAGYTTENNKWISGINNGNSPEYQQPTPKQRILAALYDIKKMTIEQEPDRSVATKMPKEQYPDITKELAIIPEDKKEVDLLIASK